MKLKTLGQLFLATTVTMGASAASAKQLWSDFSVSGLKGNDYLNPFSGEEFGREVITFEHASGHTWGGTFLFVDRLSDPDETYGEFNVNPNVYKGDGFIKNAFIGLQTEFGSSSASNFNNYLYGFGANLAVPGSSYFNVAYYRRSQDDLGIDRGDNNQVTVTWRFDSGNFRCDGFLDIVDSADTQFGKAESGYNFTPQIKYNIGPMLGMESGRLDVGMEYVYWKNKFGVDGQTEKNPNLLVKWHF